jgi:pilus assembly protein CpaB
MRPKHIFAILLLCAIGLVAVLFLRALPQNSVAATTAQLPPPPREEILVAARPLSAGLLLRAQDVTWHARIGVAQTGDIVRPSAEERAAKPESDEAARAAVYGAALRDNRAEDQPIRRSTIVKPGDRDFLQTVLTQGTRALTIPVSAASGGTGLMFPGDHVDVMLTQTFKNEDAPLTRRSVSETVVDNLRVLAIDTSTKPGAGANAITVTLELLPQQAEKINVAQELGKLSLTLRSLDEPGIAAAPARAQPPTWAGDVSPALTSAATPAKVIAAEKPDIKVMRGTSSIDTKAQ